MSVKQYIPILTRRAKNNSVLMGIVISIITKNWNYYCPFYTYLIHTSKN